MTENRAIKTAPPAAREVDDGLAASVIKGLSGAQKTLESKWLYDALGSRLFDAITALDEYYPTRTETQILRRFMPSLANRLADGTALVELGSGSSEKTRILLDALPAIRTYVPIDISAEHLDDAARDIASSYEGLAVHPVVGDFTADLTLPADLAETPKLLFFPGSTIGNFEVAAARDLLIRLHGMQNVTGFVIGADLAKDEHTLVRAYDDGPGVTAAFNMNFLHRINRELGADFDLTGFRHEARWNRDASRIEMHLVSTRAQTVTILNKTFDFADGETIHTENSHKYDTRAFADLAAEAGWTVAETWLDDNRLFAVYLLTP